jgi:hypothetical protein
MDNYNVTIMAFDDSDNNGLNQCYDNGKIVETIQADNEINAIQKAIISFKSKNGDLPIFSIKLSKQDSFDNNHKVYDGGAYPKTNDEAIEQYQRFRKL